MMERPSEAAIDIVVRLRDFGGSDNHHICHEAADVIEEMRKLRFKPGPDFDLCVCDDSRRSHERGKGRCLARKHATQCGCPEFKEAR